jgi:electron transfer flavoprotein alpha subunit
MELAPALAMHLNADCITAVVEITGQQGPPLFSRLICNAKRIAKMTSEADTTVLTIQPGAFSAGKGDATGRASIELRTMRATPRYIKSDRITPPVAQDTDMARARVIVAAGNGIGKKENLTLIRQLAGCFQKAAVAGSRIVCDRGWLGYGCQVGVTGMTVAPNLYIACGISGAAQHVSGMNTSGTVIAINKDPKAAIFNAADLSIVADLALFIPAFIKICQQEK